MEKTMASSTTQWILELVDKITGPMRKATDTAEDMTRTVDETTESVDNLGKMAEETGGVLEKWGKSVFFFNQLKDGVDTITDAFDDAIAPGVRFQSGLAEVQAISGLTSNKMGFISDKARELAKTFGIDAAEGTGVFSNILSQLGPELANYPDVLGSMAQNAMTLSKTMKGDVNGAVSALTASFNSFTPPVANATESARIMEEQMNLIAKSAQVGAAEVPDIVQSLKNIGPAAKNAGVSFAETNAVLQVLGQNQVKAADAGTALRNMMLILSAPSSDAAKALQQAGVDMGKMADKSIPLAERLQTLVPVMDDANIMARLFGRENNVAAQILIGNTDKIREWTDEVQGSTSAVDQASIIMNTYEERMKRMQAKIDDLKISFFEFVEPFAPIIKWTGVALGAIVTLGMVSWSIGNIMQLAALKTSAIWVASMVKMAVTTVLQSRIMTVAIYSIPIIGWILAIIGAITALVAYFYNTSEKFRAFLFGLWEVIKTTFIEYYKFLYNVMSAVIQVLNPANWFDDNFSFKGVWDNLVKETYEGGKRVGEAWEVGKQKGHESWTNRNKTEESSTMVIPMLNEKSQLKTDNGSGKGGYGNANGGKQGNVGLGGSGSGSTRNITMNVTMNNNFSVSGEVDYRKISERIKRELVAILSDVAPAVG